MALHAEDLGRRSPVDLPRRRDPEQPADRGKGVLGAHRDRLLVEVMATQDSGARNDPGNYVAARHVRSMRLAGSTVVRRDEYDRGVEPVTLPQRAQDPSDAVIRASHRLQLLPRPPALLVSDQIDRGQVNEEYLWRVPRDPGRGGIGHRVVLDDVLSRYIRPVQGTGFLQRDELRLSGDHPGAQAGGLGNLEQRGPRRIDRWIPV